jgi:hypothetical protein
VRGAGGEQAHADDVILLGGMLAQVGEQELPLPAEVLQVRPALDAYVGRTVGLGLRPEHVRAATADSQSRLRGRVRATEALGSELLVHLEIPAAPVLTEEVREVTGDVDAAALERLEWGGLAMRSGANGGSALALTPRGRFLGDGVTAALLA